MAYSNWGGMVYVDDKPLKQNCDATPKQVLGEKEPYILYLQHYTEPHDEEMHHAIAGDAQSDVMICLHKDYLAEIFLKDGDQWKKLPVNVSLKDYNEFQMMVGQIYVEVVHHTDPASIEVKFTDSTGRQWKAISGYCMGNGFEEWA